MGKARYDIVGENLVAVSTAGW